MSLELAWAAGFFDGEGSVGTYERYPGHTPLVRVSIQQADPEVLIRFRDAVRVGKVTGPKVYKSRPSAKPIWQYQTHKVQDLVVIFNHLKPYLSSIKYNQFDEALDMYKLLSA